MDKFDRIYALHSVLSTARIPVAKSLLEEKLECSHATIERIIKVMRLYLDAPIEYDRSANGYHYDLRSQQKYVFPTCVGMNRFDQFKQSIIHSVPPHAWR